MSHPLRKLAAVTLVTFAKAVRRHVECPDREVVGETLGEVLSAYFEAFPGVRSYVVDERGAIRRHVAVFINQDLVTDRDGQSDVVAANDRVSVYQALSGGAV